MFYQYLVEFTFRHGNSRTSRQVSVSIPFGGEGGIPHRPPSGSGQDGNVDLPRRPGIPVPENKFHQVLAKHLQNSVSRDHIYGHFDLDYPFKAKSVTYYAKKHARAEITFRERQFGGRSTS